MKRCDVKHILFFIGVLSFLAISVFTGLAQDPKPQAPVPKGPYQNQIDGIQKTITAESEHLENLKNLLRQAGEQEKAFTDELNAYKLHLSTLGNMLLLPDNRTEDLERALLDNRTAVEQIEENIKNLNKRIETVNQLVIQSNELLQINQEQLKDIKARKIADLDVDILIENLQFLLRIITSKQDLLARLKDTVTERLMKLEEIQRALAELSLKFEQKIKEKKRQNLFQRRGNLLLLLGWETIANELNALNQKIRLLVSKNFWTKELDVVWRFGAFILFTFCILFGFFLLLLHRFCRYCDGLQSLSFFAQHPHRMTVFQLFNRSLPLLGSTLFLYIYAQTQLLYTTVPVVRVVVDILWTLLISRWWLDFLALTIQDSAYQGLGRGLRSPVIIFRYFAIAYIIGDWLIGNNSVILLLGRILFESTLLVWLIQFLKRFALYANQRTEPILRRFKAPIAAVGYLTAGGALLLDLTGYSSLAHYWMTSWVRSSVVLLWSGLFFLVLKEWYAESQINPEVAVEGDKISGNPFRWVIIWISWLAWIAAVLVCIIIAWGGRQAVIIAFFKALNYPFVIGNMRFRLMGFVYASLILLITHAAARIWRFLFQNKILARSGLEAGLQESIATIAVYVLWIMGILMALHAFGLNTTSLAVAFGALGIGLGFGLQNIFNNFISGIILLFERPIQVGDAIEINGVMANVIKINVRSTVVQTWDNASLIIPNSEFISNQVTNWSFKDMRLRRNINVGVVYGSDVELVRQSLLEVAEKTPRVLKYPKPDVLFKDFGDNALIFRLRVWTLVVHMVEVETAIRFEIDRLFRERDIVIAFPQQDIHIKTVDASFPIDIRQRENPLPTPSSDDTDPST